MIELGQLTKRNIKLFFKDKGLFFSSLITPAILLILYSTFLGKVFKDSYVSNIPQGISIDDKIISSLVAGQIFSSIIAVCCVTVAFCSNMLMVQDKLSGARNDLLISPVKAHIVALSYFLSTFVSTLVVCLFASILCMIYTAVVGWFYTVADIALILVDLVLLTLFGTLLSTIVNTFLSSQGQISAVGTIVSSVYGFICGAYMPISSFGKGLQNFLMFLPSTYSTSIAKMHTMAGAMRQLENSSIPQEVVDGIYNFTDMRLSFFSRPVSIGATYGVVIGSIVVLMIAYIVIQVIAQKNTTKKHVFSAKIQTK